MRFGGTGQAFLSHRTGTGVQGTRICTLSVLCAGVCVPGRGGMPAHKMGGCVSVDCVLASGGLRGAVHD